MSNIKVLTQLLLTATQGYSADAAIALKQYAEKQSHMREAKNHQT